MLVEVVDGHWCRVWKNKTNKLSLFSVNLCSNGTEIWKVTKPMLKSEDVSRREHRVDFSPGDGSWISKWLHWLLDVAAPQRHIISVAAAPEPSLSLQYFFPPQHQQLVPSAWGSLAVVTLFSHQSVVQNTSGLHPPHVAVGTLFF